MFNHQLTNISGLELSTLGQLVNFNNFGCYPSALSLSLLSTVIGLNIEEVDLLEKSKITNLELHCFNVLLLVLYVRLSQGFTDCHRWERACVYVYLMYH